MNVDVSPDGQRIVFDLLGDIYVMPIGGSGSSPATRITSGPAFDMQPRFSPDGKRIAIASDRDGLWNIWTIDAEGKNAKQVSRERRWFINSPAWSADGSYIFARRHFVAQRSLGAGEIWMYHAAGSDGLQVTEKNGFQKDAGEPALSPDGRYLYYSKDVTPGQVFEYNKDPNGTIYAIVRRDLNTGRERTAVSVQGGSVTPRVSPDGKSLAYVRRVRLGSKLYVRDLETGRDRADLRSARQGPAGGLGDSRPLPAIRVDARRQGDRDLGRRQDLARGRRQRSGRAGRRSPRSVEQTINDAVRFQQKVHTADFQVKALRNVAVSPDGKRVVYAALGHLYVKDLPGGEPKRVTNAVALELAPRWSADGQWIVHTTWTRRRLRPRSRRPARRQRRARRGHETGPLHRAVVLSRWPVDRVPGHRQRRHARTALRRHQRHLRRPDRRLGAAAAGARRRLRSVVRRDRHARVRERLPAGEGGPRQRRHRRSGLSALRRRRRGSLPVRQRHPDRAVARRQVDRVCRAVARLRRALPAHRPAGRSVARRWRATRRRGSRGTPGSTSTGPATAAPFTGRSARTSSRAISDGPSRSSIRTSRGETIRKPKASTSASTRRRTCPPARSRSSARASSPPRATRCSRTAPSSSRGTRLPRSAARHGSCRRHADRRARQDDHAGHHRRARTRRRRRGRHPRARTAGRCSPTWRSA